MVDLGEYPADSVPCPACGTHAHGTRWSTNMQGTGIGLIADERVRQVTDENWDQAHDDAHEHGEIAWAAVCYASPGDVFSHAAGGVDDVVDPWPWDSEWDKREQHDRIRQLTIAGALVAAEIDRLLRREK